MGLGTSALGRLAGQRDPTGSPLLSMERSLGDSWRSGWAWEMGISCSQCACTIFCKYL